uniref:Meteorin-like protein n=1 Tax=Hucho hucho TaxID=62062 RepID=A0A4W5LJR9_9TELE
MLYCSICYTVSVCCTVVIVILCQYAVLILYCSTLTSINTLLLSAVGRGTIQGVEQEAEQLSVTVAISCLYRQKTQVFVSGGVRVRRWTGRVKMPRQCGVRPGPGKGDGDFLFTGSVRFGEAWMGCAPRYKDFLRLYQEAEQSGTNPCHVDTD